jgi:hypothetical protein
MGHKAVKAAIGAALTGRLAGYGQADATVIVADELGDDNSVFPVVLVRTTGMTGATHTGGGQLRATYRCRVTVGVRTDTPDPEAASRHASDARDDLLKAVRDALLHSPGLGDGVRISPKPVTEDTEPSIPTRQGPREAYGQISFDVTRIDPIPAPTTGPPPVITGVEVTTTGHPADHTLQLNGEGT